MAGRVSPSLPPIVPPAPEKLLGVCDLSLVREGREDLVRTNSEKMHASHHFCFILVFQNTAATLAVERVECLITPRLA